jgi:hypothetical protein
VDDPRTPKPVAEQVVVVDAAPVSPFRPSPRPSWFDPLVAEVDRAFAVTGADTPGWPDPHPDRNPAEDEYSRCLDPGRYRILEARVEAWCQVLSPRLATVDDEPAGPWIDAPRRPEEHRRVRRVGPTRQDGLTLILGSTLVGGEPFGLDVAITRRGMPTAFVDTVPDCGCDACDSGSADLLATLDGWFLTVARGGVVHARSERARVTRTMDGWQGAGEGELAWLDASSPVPDGVVRWVGAPWR